MSRGAGDPSTDAPSLQPGQVTRLLQEIMSVPEDSLATPSVVGDCLGRFLLVREIGRGGFGLVFEAEDTHLRRRVAIEVLRPERGRSPKTLEWIQREGEAAARVHHPTVVTLHDVGQWEGGTYLVYELLEGETLKSRLERGPLPRPEARQVLRSVAMGLAQMHAAGVIHRDLKPGNVFIETDGGMKILDLGLAQVAGAVGIVAGSPPYAAPEQWEGKATDARADVFAWGVLAQRLLTGKASGAATGPVEARPLTFRALAEQARAPDPALRPADGMALLAALDRLDRRKRRATLLAAPPAWGSRSSGPSTDWAGCWGLALRFHRDPSAWRSPTRRTAAESPRSTASGDLVARELQASPRFQVLDRARLDGVLRASGRAAPERLDRGIAGFATRQAGGAALLVPVIGVDGDGLPLSIDALEPESGRRLFSVAERASSEDDVVRAVGRLVARARAQLSDRELDVRGADKEVSRAVSSSLQAHRHYLAGVRCMDVPSGAGGSSFENCDTHFLQALAIDPEFPLAHFELARIRWWADYPLDDLRRSLEIPLRNLDRLSSRERSMVLAWDASLSPTPGKAVEILLVSAKDFPEDTRIAYALAEALLRQGRRAEASPPSGAGHPARSRVRARERHPGVDPRNTRSPGGSPPRGDPAGEHAAVDGDPDRRSEGEGLHRGRGGGASGPAARGTRRLRPGPGPPGGRARGDRPLGRGRGDAPGGRARRPGAGREPPRPVPAPARARAGGLRLPLEAPPPFRRAPALLRRSRLLNQFLVPRRDLAGVQAVVDRTVAWSPETAAQLAPAVAYAGGLDRAVEMRRSPWIEGPGAVLAIATWRREGPAAALPGFRSGPRRTVSAEAAHRTRPPGTPPSARSRLLPDATALDAIRRFQRFYYPLGQWRTWAYPRSLLLEARVLDRLGSPVEARKVMAKLEDLLSQADPDFPLLAEARVLRRKLGRGQPVAATAPDPGGRTSKGGD